MESIGSKAALFVCLSSFMLNPAYRYVSLDFETTGLDTQKDHIIQVGVVLFDDTGKIVDEFVSLIRPENYESMTTMTAFITWLSEQDIQSAPALSEIQDRFRSFFDQNTVVIWHNIWFDMAFVERFFPWLPYLGTIDTYPRSQNFLHFVPSFALEVLCQYLVKNKETFVPIYNSMRSGDHGQSTFHDALYDAKCSTALFLYIARHLQTLIATYPQISYILSNTPSQLFYGTVAWSVTKNLGNIPVMPLLQRSITAPQLMVKKSDTPNFSAFPDKTQFYIGNMSTTDIASYIAQQKNAICVFSHKTKADTIKHLLHDMGVYGIASLYEDQFFNQSRFDVLMRKTSFSEEEANFLCKYLSHHMQCMGIMDIQQEYEKRIVYFLQEIKPTQKAPLVFATHSHLYQHMKKYPDFYAGYTVYFFDQDRRYITYNDFASNTYDPEYFMKLLEKIVYTYRVCYETNTIAYKEKYESIQEFYAFVQIFVGVLSVDVSKIFDERPAHTTSLQLDPLLYHHGLYQTQKLRETMLVWRERLQQIFPESVYKDIVEHIDTLDMLLSSMVTVDKRQYDSGKHFFMYKETNRYVQWDEFLEVLQWYRTIFFSHYNTQYRLLQEQKKSLGIPTIRATPNSIMDHIRNSMQTENRIFVVSTQKHMSQSLFDMIHAQWLHQEYTILAENITWWAGKNIFLWQQADKTIIIGGYSFLLQCIAKRLYVDKVLVFFIKWAMEKLLLCDMQRYASK